MRKGHPAASLPLSLDRYVQLDHLKVTGVGSSAVDEALALQGLMRRIVFKMPSWLEMLPVIESTDVVAAMPSHWQSNPKFMANCVAKPLPLDLLLPIEAVWHPRNDDDPAHRWLRNTVRKLFAAFQQEEGSR